MLHELLGFPGPMTARQYALWEAWDEWQWNRPDRGDHYLMQVAMRVDASGLTQSGRNAVAAAGLEPYKIPFRKVAKARPKPKSKAERVREASEAAKSQMRAGKPGEVRTIRRSELPKA